MGKNGKQSSQQSYHGAHAFGWVYGHACSAVMQTPGPASATQSPEVDQRASRTQIHLWGVCSPFCKCTCPAQQNLRCKTKIRPVTCNTPLPKQTRNRKKKKIKERGAGKGGWGLGVGEAISEGRWSLSFTLESRARVLCPAFPSPALETVLHGATHQLLLHMDKRSPE